VNRREFVSVAAWGLLAAPLTAEAQPAGKVPRIGFLHSAGATEGVQPGPFIEGMRQLGHDLGTTYVLENRWTFGRPDRFGELAAELVRLNVDVIVTHDTAAALAAKQATAKIPIVFAYVSDPIGTGVVPSLAKPGGNVTGISFAQGDGFSGKLLQLIHQAAPKARTIAVLWNRGNPANARALDEMESAARTLNLKLLAIEVHEPEGLDSAFKAMHAGPVGGLVVLPGPFTNTYRRRIIDLAATTRLAAIYPFRMYVEDGGLMAYGPSLEEPYRRAATYVDKILKGAKPGDLPVEQPTKIEMVINLKTAKALGLTIPPGSVRRYSEGLTPPSVAGRRGACRGAFPGHTVPAAAGSAIPAGSGRTLRRPSDPYQWFTTT
jgi:putative ABC transport system substrate-binding protein